MLDLGEGLAVAFKVESHNHPSAVEPFQGAATGIGGILRDIVAMGARPVALLDGLWFGEPDFQFERTGEVPNIGAVLARLDAELHPVAVATWFTLPNPDLVIEGEPVSPRDWLRSGGAGRPVATLAAAL